MQLISKNSIKDITEKKKKNLNLKLNNTIYFKQQLRYKDSSYQMLHCLF